MLARHPRSFAAILPLVVVSISLTASAKAQSLEQGNGDRPSAPSYFAILNSSAQTPQSTLAFGNSPNSAWNSNQKSTPATESLSSQGIATEIGEPHKFEMKSEIGVLQPVDNENVVPQSPGQSEELKTIEQKSVEDLDMSAKWNHGLELKSKNGDFRVHVGGRTQFDAGWFGVNDNVDANINEPYQNGVDLRRARLRVDGTMYKSIDWAAEYNFVEGQRTRNSAGTGTTDFAVTTFTDLYLTFKELPRVGNLRIGNQKEPIGFEHLVSSRFLPFMERSYNQDAFYGGSFNGFSPGIQAFNTYGCESGTWALGLFKPVSNGFAYSANDSEYAVTGRVTKLLWFADDASDLLHLGGSFRQFTTVDNQIRFRTREAVRTGLSTVWPIPADTGTLLGDDGTFFNGELVRVFGSWTFQAEYLVSFLTDAQTAGPPAGPLADEVMYHGGYVQLLHFLTGEHDNYDRKTGCFGRVIPLQNYRSRDGECGSPCGNGAWQIGARYNFLDLNDNGINGGELSNGTLGLNWFLNPNLKMQFDYILTHRDAPLAGDAGDGWINGFGYRLAVDF